jgi:phenylpropionate dioxygenase-like ring-hydroxylating dioxygenase large terminal subunit
MSGISDAAYDRLLSHLRAGTTDLAENDLHVPISNFASDDRAAAELRLFRTLPLLVAHASELPEPGSFIVRDVLGTSVLVVRQEDDSVAAFLNMCRHRGGKIETDPSGHRRLFVCRYHGWSYERNGALRAVPYSSSFEPIDRSCNGLKPVKCEQRHGLIWLDFSNQATRTVADYLGPEADSQLANFGLDGAVVFLERSIPLDINWKLVADGAIDVLHPQFLHPNTVGKLVQANIGVWNDYGRHGQRFGPRKKYLELIKSGKSDRTYKHFSSSLILFPNVQAIMMSDHVELWTVWPSESASKCTAQIRFLVRQDALDDRMTERLRKSADILNDAIMNEDFPMEASIQENCRANPKGTFLYGRGELSCQHLHRELQKALQAVDVADPATRS